MRWVRQVWRKSAWLIVLAMMLSVPVQAWSDAAPHRAQEIGEISAPELPREARETLERIRRGGPFPYDRDGITFGNYEKRLPVQRRGHYREYTVTTPGLSHRGARRIVVGCERQRPVAQPPGPPGLAYCRGGGEFYYTADHYRSFRRIIE